jgi:hypothetical protein
MSKALKEGLQVAALGIGVTILGLVVGAFLMSPSVSREQRFTAFAALGGAAGLVLLIDLGRRGMAAVLKRRSKRATLSSSHRTAAAAPTIKLGGRSSRTPRAVQALAAAGAAPTEIAWKTGLPLDAVSMLLEIGAPR